MVGNERIDFLMLGLGDTKEIFSKTTYFRLNFIASLPKGRTDLVRSLAADIRLKEHLHGEFAGLAAMAGGQAEPPVCSFLRRLAISIAAIPASKPLLPALMPARLRACSNVSHVSTPKL